MVGCSGRGIEGRTGGLVEGAWRVHFPLPVRRRDTLPPSVLLREENTEPTSAPPFSFLVSAAKCNLRKDFACFVCFFFLSFD